MRRKDGSLMPFAAYWVTPPTTSILCPPLVIFMNLHVVCGGGHTFCRDHFKGGDWGQQWLGWMHRPTPTPLPLTASPGKTGNERNNSSSKRTVSGGSTAHYTESEIVGRSGGRKNKRHS